MRVAVCVTKDGPVAYEAYEALRQGVIHCNDELVCLSVGSDINTLEGCDVAIYVGETNRFILNKKSLHGTMHFRHEVFDQCKKHNIRRLVIDSGYINHIRNRRNNPYYSFGFDGIKKFSSYYNDSSPSDRLDKLDINISPWKNSGDIILLCASAPTGWTSSLYNHRQWIVDTINKLLKTCSNKHIKIKTHPNIAHYINNQIPKKNIICGHVRLEDLSENIRCVICAASNISIDAIKLGIPVICPCDFNMVHPHCEQSIENIDNIIQFDRQQLFNDLSYAQYNIEEISNGSAWHRMRQYVHKPPSYEIDIEDYVRTHNSKRKLSI